MEQNEYTEVVGVERRRWWKVTGEVVGRCNTVMSKMNLTRTESGRDRWF